LTAADVEFTNRSKALATRSPDKDNAALLALRDFNSPHVELGSESAQNVVRGCGGGRRHKLSII